MTVPAKPKAEKKVAKLGAEKLTPDEQRRRFIETARKLGSDETGKSFEDAFGKIVPGSRAPT